MSGFGVAVQQVKRGGGAALGTIGAQAFQYGFLIALDAGVCRLEPHQKAEGHRHVAKAFRRGLGFIDSLNDCAARLFDEQFLNIVVLNARRFGAGRVAGCDKEQGCGCAGFQHGITFQGWMGRAANRAAPFDLAPIITAGKARFGAGRVLFCFRHKDAA